MLCVQFESSVDASMCLTVLLNQQNGHIRQIGYCEKSINIKNWSQTPFLRFPFSLNIKPKKSLRFHYN